MTLIIKQKGTKKIPEIIVGFAKEVLTISENSNEWSNEGINKFLISLASKTPDGEKITIEYDEENEDPTFKHIVQLFKEFTEQYNESI